MTSKTDKQQYELYYHYRVTSTGGEIKKGQEDEEWPDFTDEYCNVELPDLIYLRKANDKRNQKWNGNQEVFDLPEGVKVGDTLYLVVVRYTTGGTFGAIHGAVGFEGLYTVAGKAAYVASSIEDDTYFQKGKYEFWKGYFERLESVLVKKVEVV